MGHKLGLHTKEERAFAVQLCDESFARGMEIAKRGNPRELCDVTFEVGILHAVALLARQEGADLLDEHASRLKSVLDREVRKMGR